MSWTNTRLSIFWTMADAVEFTYRSARSGAVISGLAIAVVVETVAVHLWLRDRLPLVAWTLAALTALTLVWLLLEFRAWSTGRFRVDASKVDLSVAGRSSIVLLRGSLSVVPSPTWRDMPSAGPPGYLNLTAPAQPNVLLRPSTPVSIRLVGGLLRRTVTTIGVHVDDPAGFAATLGSVQGVREPA
jgi:hypothetical protein